jgi:hypothetical protein
MNLDNLLKHAMTRANTTPRPGRRPCFANTPCQQRHLHPREGVCIHPREPQAVLNETAGVVPDHAEPGLQTTPKKIIVSLQKSANKRFLHALGFQVLAIAMCAPLGVRGCWGIP